VSTSRPLRVVAAGLVGILVVGNLSGCGGRSNAPAEGQSTTATPPSAPAPAPAPAATAPAATVSSTTTPAPVTTLDQAAAATTTATREPVCPSAAPGDTTIRLTSGGVERTALVHPPSGYDATTPSPMVIDLHGHGGNSKAAQNKHGFDAKADRNGVIMVYPQGVEQLDGRNGWSTGAANRDPGTVDDLVFVGDLLDELSRLYCVDRQRTFATGHSNGGGMTGLLACALADRFVAFAPVSGAFYPAERRLGPAGCSPGRAVPILEIHGTADQVVPYGGGGEFLPIPEWTAGWAGRNGCTGSAVSGERTVWTGCDAPVEHIAVAGAEHEYPPGSADAVWDFFSRMGL
jgi:polyhydroxybutyrate depolymerase